MSGNDPVFKEILQETRELNRHLKEQLDQQSRYLQTQHTFLQEIIDKNKANQNTLEEMARYLVNYQDVIDFAINDLTKTNEAVLRELKSQFSKLAMLFNPELIGLTRLNNKIISSEDEPVVSQNIPIQNIMAQNAKFGDLVPSRAFYRTGFQENVSQSDLVWINEGVDQCPETPTLLRVKSTSDEDGATGIGVRSIYILGLDASYNRISEVVPTNGTEASDTTQSFTHIDRFAAYTTGSGGYAAGTISLTNLAENITYAKINTGYSSWRGAKFHTSKSDVAYIHSWSFSAYNAVVRGELWCSIRPGFLTGAIMARALGVAKDNTFQLVFPIPIRVSREGFVAVKGIAKSPTSEVTTSFELFVRPEEG